MNWIESIMVGAFILVLVAMMRSRKKSGRSCCSGEGMDDDGCNVARDQEDKDDVAGVKGTL